MTHVLETDLWWVRLTALITRVWLKTLEGCLGVRLALCQTHCKQVPVFFRISGNHVITWSKLANHSHWHFTHVSYPQFLHTVQYGLCFGYFVSGPLPLRSHKDRSHLRGHFCESLIFRWHSKLARSILLLKLSVTTTVHPKCLGAWIANKLIALLFADSILYNLAKCITGVSVFSIVHILHVKCHLWTNHKCKSTTCQSVDHQEWPQFIFEIFLFPFWAWLIIPP